MPGILLVDDHPTQRDAIRSFLAENNISICGEATDGLEALAKTRDLSPDVVLLDINMPVMNGIQAARELRRIAPAARIIFLTVHDAPETAAALKHLADDVVAKSSAATELIPALERLAEKHT
jgi:two-component system nitrate/nitrite response regulator NarL